MVDAPAGNLPRLIFSASLPKDARLAQDLTGA